MAFYCAHRERCTSEVESKMTSLGIPKHIQQGVIEFLQKENYLNDQRFVFNYVRSKFYRNCWGKIRIRMALRQKRLPASLIGKALEEIQTEEYYQTLLSLAEKKASRLKKSLTKSLKRQALFRFLVIKGFEANLVDEVVRTVVP
ncbi:MAG: regulatory protein RecX [Cytophagales bacterium]|nr:recombination regulator RecX [Bernardetiaceae bacterium]MDW8209838.1 regulatory protein RecX [Cytophagales bacterium]